MNNGLFAPQPDMSQEPVGDSQMPYVPPEGVAATKPKYSIGDPALDKYINMFLS